MSQPTDTQQQEVSGGAVRIKAAAPAEQTRVILFYIGEGDDEVAYTVPKRVPANWGVQFIEVAALMSPAAAQIWLFEKMLGDEAMEDLKNADGMEPEDWQALRDKFDDMFAPQVEELLNPKGTQRSSRRWRGSRS